MGILTEKERNILDLIVRYIEEHRIAPTNRELVELTGLKSTSTIHGYIEKLERKGYISRRKEIPRSIIININ